MGLFDFLKKKKLTQSSSAKELNAPNSQGIQSKESAPPFVKKEVVAKTPLVEISVEQDGPLPLSIQNDAETLSAIYAKAEKREKARLKQIKAGLRK